MQTSKQEFIELCLACGVLKFGEFVLKSGRLSPYFFNAGMFKTGQAFSELSKHYARAINNTFDKSEYDLLFGPAYKGIVLATVASMALSGQGVDLPVTFNRKEAKDHGEGGLIIGEPLKNHNAILIDDVITAGTTVKESVNLIDKEGGKLAGIIIALDRQEKGTDIDLSAILQVKAEYGLKVGNIITRDDLIDYIKMDANFAKFTPKMEEYKAKYGC